MVPERRAAMAKHRFEVYSHVLTSDGSMAAARSLMSLAGERREHASALAASAALAIASALEQDVHSCYRGVVESRGFDNRDDLPQALPDDFEHMSLRHKMRTLPAWLTNGRMELNRRSPYVDALHDLITLRNALLHVVDEPLLLDDSDGRVTVDEEGLRVDIPLTTPLWFSQTLENTTRLMTAVELFHEQVVVGWLGEVETDEIAVPVAATQ
jgi:hypothetical protein